MERIIKKTLFNLLLRVFLGLGKVLQKNQLPKVAKLIANLFYCLPLKRKSVAFENLKISYHKEFPEKNLGNLLKNFFAEIALMILEISYNIVHRDSLIPLVKACGLEYLENAMQKGKGVIALSGHLSNIPVMLAWLAEKGYPVAVLFKEGKYLPKGFLYNLIKSYNIHPIPFYSDREVPKQIIKALKEDKIVFILADQARPGVYAKFFGYYVQCQKGPFVIAKRRGCPIVPIFIVREKKYFLLKVYPELPLSKNKIAEEDEMISLIEKYNSLLENLIRQYPEQYYWFHRRFKKMKTH